MVIDQWSNYIAISVTIVEIKLKVEDSDSIILNYFPESRGIIYKGID